MSDATSPFDAYQPPQEVPQQKTPADKAWGRVKVVCIIAIILGALGLLTMFMAAFNLAFGKQLQTAFTPAAQPGLPQDFVQTQTDMQNALYGVQEKYWFANLGVTVIHACVATALLVGAILCLKRRKKGLQILIVACISAILFEIVRGVITTLVTLDSLPITTAFAKKMMEASGGNTPPQAAEMMVTVMKASMIGGLVFSMIIVLAKIIFYLIATRILKNPEVAPLMEV